MNKENLRNSVMSELGHIPRGIRGSDQNTFVGVYYWIRMHDLSYNISISRLDSLNRALSYMELNYQGFNPSYDRKYFELELSSRGSL